MIKKAYIMLAATSLILLCGCNSRESADTNVVEPNSEIIEAPGEIIGKLVDSEIEMSLSKFIRGSEFCLTDMANTQNCGEVEIYVDTKDNENYEAYVKDVIINDTNQNTVASFIITDGTGYITLYWNIEPENPDIADIESFKLSVDLMKDGVVAYTSSVEIAEAIKGGSIIDLTLEG